MREWIAETDPEEQLAGRGIDRLKLKDVVGLEVGELGGRPVQQQLRREGDERGV